MNLLQAFDLGRKCGRAEKQAEGTRYALELLAMTDKCREGIAEINDATTSFMQILEVLNGPAA